MCGIAGQYFHEPADRAGEIRAGLATMMLALRHRGPDAHGEMVLADCGLGMTRLSIIDLDTGNQPIFDESRRYSIVFNGEIYNYRLLRDQLMAEGARFSTRSDTEVILQGYLRKGEQFLGELQGMFALAIYDSQSRELFVARDRLGKKPFYYYLDHERFAFASEAQALARVVGSKLDVDGQSYWDYLTFRYVPGDGCALKGLKKLPPGHFMKIGNSSPNPDPVRFWDIPRSTAHLGAPARGGQGFGRLFADSVKMRLVSDVPVGVVLSGGIDSAAVLYEARKSQPIGSYHVVFRAGEAYDELKYAELTARHLGSKLQVVEMGEDDFLSTLDRMPSLTDEPLSDLASVPFKRVCDLAAKDVKVVLSGEGSDEVLAGYGLHYLRRNFILMKLLGAVPGGRAAIARIAREPGSRLGQLAGPDRDWGARNNFNITFHASQAMKCRLLARNAAPLLDSARHLQQVYGRYPEEDPINQLLHAIMTDWLVEDVLMKSDKVSMSSSLEVRCPFLDHRLVEFLFTLPGSAKIGWRRGRLESKAILRKYLEGKIPGEVLNRKKLGFPVPAYALSSRKYRDYLFDALSAGNRFYERLFDRAKILALYDSELPGKESEVKHFLWCLAGFERWYDQRKACLG